jgi:hypothetical protein
MKKFGLYRACNTLCYYKLDTSFIQTCPAGYINNNSTMSCDLDKIFTNQNNKNLNSAISQSNFTENSNATTVIIDKCTPNPCQNNGTCTTFNKSIVICNCTNFYDGEFCETSKKPSKINN